MNNLELWIHNITAMIPAFNAMAVLLALVAGWITGWLWYLLADRAWKAATKNMESESPVPRAQIRAAIAQVIMTIMLAIVIDKFGGTTLLNGLSIAFMMWFGFVMTTIMVNHSHLGAKLSLTFIDGIHWLLVLSVMGAIIGALGADTMTSADTVPSPSAMQPAPAAPAGN